MIKDIKFKGKVRQWSNSFIVTIPMSYIDNDLLAEGKTYEFTCKEIKTEDVERGVVKRMADDGDYFVLYDNLDMKMVTGDEPYTAKKTPKENIWREKYIPWYERF